MQETAYQCVSLVFVLYAVSNDTSLGVVKRDPVDILGSSHSGENKGLDNYIMIYVLCVMSFQFL